MKLNKPEKLILLMLADIYKKLEINDDESAVDADFVARAIYGGQSWALSEKGGVGRLNDDDPTLDEADEIRALLDMWARIEEANENFSPEEQERVRAESGVYPRFLGIDLNTEDRQLRIAEFLVDHIADDNQTFARFKGRDLNSHRPMMDAYRRAFSSFEEWRKQQSDPRHLGAEDVIRILKSMKEDRGD